MEENKNSMLNRIIEALSAIFLPIINVVTAAGVTKGFLALFVSLGWVESGSGTYIICSSMADSLFYFLPIFIAFTSAKQFGCDRFTAAVIGGLLVHPNITAAFESGVGLDFAGIPVTSVNYPSSVLPILMAVGFLHFVEKFLKKVVPKMLSGFLVPLLSILITGAATLLLFGPLGTWIGDLLAAGYTAAYEWSPQVSGFFLGGLIQVMVIFGFHWSIVPIIISNIALYGYDTILPFMGAAIFAQAGAALAVFFKVKDSECKTRVMSAVVSALFSVTEPALFGVNVPLKKPMVAACIAGAIGGALVGFTGARAIAFAFAGIPTLPVYMGEGFLGFLGTCILGFVLAFIMTMFMKIDTEIIEKVPE